MIPASNSNASVHKFKIGEALGDGKLFGSLERFPFLGGALHNQHRTMGRLQNTPGYTTHDKVFHSGPPVSPYHDQIYRFFLR